VDDLVVGDFVGEQLPCSLPDLSWVIVTGSRTCSLTRTAATTKAAWDIPPGRVAVPILVPDQLTRPAQVLNHPATRRKVAASSSSTYHRPQRCEPSDEGMR